MAALAVGNLENFLIASTPGGIEASEKRGQMDQARKQTLPLELGQRTRGKIEDFRAPWIALGFKFGAVTEEIFVECEFPKGWKKEPTDHDMWSDILDEKGRKRGSIFYKAAFYDRSAHARLTPRFYVSSDYDKPTQTVSVADALGEVKFCVSGLEKPDWGACDRPTAERKQAKIDEARAACEQYLKTNFPDYENPSAYWDSK